MKKTRRQRGSIHYVLGVTALSLALFAVVGWAVYRLYRSEFPDVSALATQFAVVHYEGPKEPPRITLQRARPAGWVKLAEMSRLAVGAVVVSEDWAFFSHKGYDPNQIREAVEEDLREGRFARGASTITQQVVKNVFLSREKSVWRKFKELILAVRLEGSVSKHRILETYLNVAEWGEGVFGIGAAARQYFGKAPEELTAKEGAFLAMLLPSPKRYSQSFRRKELTRYARRTVRDILDKMTQARYLSLEERDLALGSPLSFEEKALNYEEI